MSDVFGRGTTIGARASIPVCDGPISDIAVSAGGSRLVVSNYGRDSVSMIDADTCRVVETVPGLGEPFSITMSGDRAYISTAAAAYDAIDVIDIFTGSVVATHRLALSVSDFTVSPDGKTIYASRNGARGADVAVIDAATDHLEVIELADQAGTTTQFVRVSSDGKRVYVGTNGAFGGQVAVIETVIETARTGGNPGRIVGTFDLGLPVRDLVLSADGATAYVASYGPVVGAVLDVVDTRTGKIVGTRKIGEEAGTLTRLTLSRDGGRVYALFDEGIAVLSTSAPDLVSYLQVAGHPSAVAENPDGETLYIADYSGVVTVLPVLPTRPAARELAAGRGDAPWAAVEHLSREALLV